MNKNYLGAVLIVGVVYVACLMNPGFFRAQKTEAAASDNVSGYAWSGGSDTGPGIGWISFNCTNDGSCATSPYGVSIDPTTGLLSGYAWANPRDDAASTDSVGWISFNPGDLAVCPGGAGNQANLDLTTGKGLRGFARALVAATDPQAAWDGCIRFNGVSYDFATGKFSGYAWGSDVVGWVDFGAVSVNPPLVPTGPTATLSGSDCTINPGASLCNSLFFWNIQGATSPNLYNATRNLQYSTLSKNPAGGLSRAITGGVNVIQARDKTAVINSISVTGSCTAGYAWDGSKCVYVPPPPVISLAAAPTRVQTGSQSTISWAASNVSTCSLTGPGLTPSPRTDFSAATTSQSVTIVSQSTYTLTCDGTSQKVTVNIVPVYNQF